MNGKCVNNSNCFRTDLTIGRTYSGKIYKDPNAGYDMFEITNDLGNVKSFRADRFIMEPDKGDGDATHSER